MKKNYNGWKAACQMKRELDFPKDFFSPVLFLFLCIRHVSETINSLTILGEGMSYKTAQLLLTG